MLLLDERIRADGTHVRTWATSLGDHVRIVEDDGPSGDLPLLAVDHVMRRYGRPLDPGIALEGASLTWDKYRLRRLRHHAAVDAEGRDYLVWERPDGEPLVCVAVTVTAALRYLTRQRGGERPQESEA